MIFNGNTLSLNTFSMKFFRAFVLICVIFGIFAMGNKVDATGIDHVIENTQTTTPCSKTIEDIKQNIADTIMMIEECVYHCEQLEKFDALYIGRQNLNDVSDTLSGVCRE